MQQAYLTSEFLQYLVTTSQREDDQSRLPALNELSTELGISVARLREQLEVARALGLVEVRPRTGIRCLPYSFLPAVRLSLAFAMEIDRTHFDEFSELRNHIEATFWYEAVSKLMPEDLDELKNLMKSAWDKLHSPQVKIPHDEHRRLHLGIFKRLNNLFVSGILEAYWEAYEAVGLNVYADYNYLEQVWHYHQKMVNAICAGDLQAGYRALVEHKDLLYHRPVATMMKEAA
ncbi:MAG TPA: FCD domain-containing protein [Anaerolineales bacterium]|nr:FCD domain-containing protein [Anaerolineales bacterium]